MGGSDRPAAFAVGILLVLPTGQIKQGWGSKSDATGTKNAREEFKMVKIQRRRKGNAQIAKRRENCPWTRD